MKVSLYESGGRLEGGYTIPGMTLTGPLLLSGVVNSPTEAVHKQYVDTAVTNLDAANFVSGTIPTARMPGLTGDITTTNGSNVVTLAASGVIAGDYTKVAVDAKGRVTNGLSLTEADLPNLSWGKITTNKPTTLAGYGITDGVSLQNGVLTGALTLANAPTEANHAVTKAYAESNAGSGAKLTSGDIISTVTNVTPTGFLRCNGGQVSKTTHSALYAVIGDNFTGGNTLMGSGQPWRQQYAINFDQNTNALSWKANGVLPANVTNAQVVVTKNRVYLLGGYNGSVYVSSVYTAPINSDGTIGAWTSSTALPLTMGGQNVVVTKNRVYMIGGLYNGTTTTAIYYAAINADGTLGTWVTDTNFPVQISTSAPVITKDRIYMIGGYVLGTGGGAIDTVYTAPISAEGVIGAWTVGPALPVKTYAGQAVVTKNRVYFLGGVTVAGATTAVYTSAINADGTLVGWSAGTPLPQVNGYSQAVVLKNRVYLIGGILASGGDANVYTAPINADGTLGTWKIDSVLAGQINQSQAIVTKSLLYLIGGRYSTSSATSAIFSTPLAGGLNDCSSYYDGTMTVTDSNSFRIPDYASYEKSNSYYFIKT